MEMFMIYFKKMQELLEHPKIVNLMKTPEPTPQPISPVNNNGSFTQKTMVNINDSMIQKTIKKEKMRSLLKENQKENEQKAKKLIECFQSNKDETQGIILSRELSSQEISFKERLKNKKLNRGNSQPHIYMQNKLSELKKEEEMSSPIVNILNKSSHPKNRKEDQNLL